MATEGPLTLPYTFTAGADLSSDQYKFVKLSTSTAKTVSRASVAGEACIGVLQNKPTSGQDAVALCLGVTKVKAGGSFNPGVAITTDANGLAVAATGSDAILGYSFAAGVNGQVTTICLAARGGQGATLSSSVIAIPIQLATIPAGDVLTNWTPGFAGTITKVSFAVTVAATTASKAATLNLEIGTTNLTGGVVSLTSANCTPLGAVIAGTAVTAGNTFTASDTISVEGSSVTAFIEGAGVLLISIQA